MNTFLFILMFIISLSVTGIFLHEIRNDNKGKKSAGKIRSIRSMARGAAVFLFSVGAADNLNLINFGIYAGAFFLLGITSIFSFLLCEINKKKKYPVIAFAVKAMMIAAVLEVTLFNLPFYRLWGKNFTEMNFKAEQFASSMGVNYRPAEKDIMIKGTEEISFTLEGINEEVGNVFIDLNFENGTKGAEIFVDAMDETQTTIYRENIGKGMMVRDRWGSQFTDLQLSGKVSDMRIRIVPINGGIVYINGITLNTSSPMDVSMTRFLAIVLLSSFIYLMFNSRIFNRCFVENRKFCRGFTVVLTVLLCVVTVWITHYKLGFTWKDALSLPEGDQMSQELVEAFENGSTSLLNEPAESLKNFDNPYDRALRESVELDIEWDHVYFDQKYYSYYGIAPVILLFMPFHLITGHFLHDGIAIMIFSFIGIIGLSFLFMKIVEKFFPKTPTGLFITALIILHTISGIWFSIGRPQFYETAMAAGFAFLTWAVYFMISAGIIGKEKPSLPKTAISSLLFAVAVLSRPTLVLYCICAAVFMIAALKRASGKAANPQKNKLFNSDGVKYILCALLPMVCLGLVQMWYNYSRFGNPFEFGIQYSLTINDFTKAQFHWQLSLVALFNYFFNAPVITPVYPIVSTKFQFMNVNGFFYEDFASTVNSSGLFFLALPMFAYFLAPRALKTFPDRRMKLSRMAYIGIPCLLIPIIIVASVWESGYAVRYMVDFSWQALLGAFAVIFYLYSKTDNETLKKLAKGFMCFSLIWTLFIAGVQNVNQIFCYTSIRPEYPEIAYDVEQFFAFWK